MEYETISFELRDGIAVIKLNRPDVMNALNPVMRSELLTAVREAGEKARVTVLTGEGRAFCSGQDLGDRVDVADLDIQRVLVDEYEPLVRAICDSPAPVICAVNGPAAGAGANLALAADVVIATESAYFVEAFSKIGLIPDAGGTYFMPRQVGMARAMGMALFAEKVSARQAADWGLIWEAVPDEEFSGHIDMRAAQIAAGPGAAFRRIKAAIRASFENGFDAQLDLEAKLQGEAGKTRDFKEGVLAFMEKRAPNFEGR